MLNLLNDFERQAREADGQTENQQFTAQLTENIQSDVVLKALNRNADGDAELYVELHRGIYVYDHAGDHWYYWAGHHWEEDRTGLVIQSVGNVVAVYEEEVKRQAWRRLKTAKEQDKDAETKLGKIESALFKRIRLLQTLNRKREVLILARSGENTLGINGEEWDKDPWLLGVQNGVVDLRTGELMQGVAEQYIKTAAPTEWAGINARCPFWDKFLIDIFGGDLELSLFIQRLLGYGLTGLTWHHVFTILWGRGRNGKGTLLETLRAVLGKLAMKAEAELLLEQKNSKHAGAPNSAVLSLRGKRLVWCSETNEGRKLDAGKLKELVGGDTLSARGIFAKHHVEFAPTHTLFLLTNYRPTARAEDYALWKRIFLIPFTQSFVDNPTTVNERKTDPALPERLKTEAPGILAWLVRGCLAWQKEGLNPPRAVTAATAEYQADEDILGQFLDERTAESDSDVIKGKKLYDAYVAWADAARTPIVSRNEFGRKMKERLEYEKVREGVVYRRRKLLPDANWCDGCDG